MKPGTSFTFALAALLAAQVAHAQDNIGAQIGTQQDVLRRGASTTVEQRIPFRVTDPELGEIDLVARTPRPKMFTFSTDQNLFYTTNAFLSRNGEQDDVFWNGHFLASFVPYATVNFTPRLTFEQNFFRYDDFSRLDFDSNSLTFDAKFDFNRDDTLFANVSYTGSRLYSPHGNEDEFYRYGLLNASLTMIRPLGNLPLRTALTFGSNWRHGDPSDFDRVTAYINAVVAYAPMQAVQLLAFLRPELQFYIRDPDSHARKDLNVSAGTSATWTPIEYFSLGATATLTGNYSTTGQNEYFVFLPSVVVAGRFSF